MDLTNINQLFNYTEWANNLAMDVAAKLSDDNLRRDVGISHQCIFGTLLHMAGAEWIWLERWNGRSPAKAEAWSQWTTQSCADVAALKDRWMEVVDRRWRYVSELDNAKLTSIAAQIVVGQSAGRIHCQGIGPFCVVEELLDVC